MTASSGLYCLNHHAENISNFPTVLIISYHFYPAKEIGARRLTALAQHLAERGVRVVVVSAFGKHSVERATELIPGVTCIPVRRPGRPWLDLMVALKRWLLAQSNVTRDTGSDDAADQPSGPGSRTYRARLRERYFRLVNFVDDYKRWSWRAARAAVCAGREYGATLVLASGPPHSGLLAGAWAARRLGVPYVGDLRDPLSDFVSVSHPDRRFEVKMLRALERVITRCAAALTSTSAAAASLLVQRNPDLASRIHVIRNGYDGRVAPPLTDTGGRLSILFAGTLYLRRSPYPLLAALEELLGRPDIDATRIRLTFMGDKFGRFSDQALERWLQGKRCAAVIRILPPQSAEGVAREVAQATVLLNLAQQQHLHVPAKTYEHLATGREMLLICEDACETAQLVSGIHGVNQADQSDPHVLARVLLDLYNRHVVARDVRVPAAADISRFSRRLTNEHFHAVLSSIVEPVNICASDVVDAVISD